MPSGVRLFTFYVSPFTLHGWGTPLADFFSILLKNRHIIVRASQVVKVITHPYNPGREGFPASSILSDFVIEETRSEVQGTRCKEQDMPGFF